MHEAYAAALKGSAFRAGKRVQTLVDSVIRSGRFRWRPWPLPCCRLTRYLFSFSALCLPWATQHSSCGATGERNSIARPLNADLGAPATQSTWCPDLADVHSVHCSYGDYASFHLPAAAPPLDEPAGAGGVSGGPSAAAEELHKRLVSLGCARLAAQNCICSSCPALRLAYSYTQAVLEEEHKAAEAAAAKLTNEMGSTRKECDQ